MIPENPEPDRRPKCRVCNCEIVESGLVSLSHDIECVVAFKYEVWANKGRTRKKLHTGMVLNFMVCRACFPDFLNLHLPKKAETPA